MYEQLLKNPVFVVVMPAVRYLVFAGVAYGIVWKLLAPRLAHRRTSARKLSEAKISHEIRWSLSSMGIFGLVALCINGLQWLGIVEISSAVSRYGTLYVVATTIGLILWHDAYFYFTHRALHHPMLFRFHKTHHESIDPSPWAAFSFHPVEAVINAMVLPIPLLLLPMHPISLGLFLLYTIFMNVWGHLGHELYGRGLEKTWAFRVFNTTTHHAMHHRVFNANYGLYFNWWDRWLGTNHAQYVAEYVRNTTRVPERGTLESCAPLTANSAGTFSTASSTAPASTGSAARTGASSTSEKQKTSVSGSPSTAGLAAPSPIGRSAS